MVPPCPFFMYLDLLLGGASLGILSGSSLISPFSALYFPFLPSSPFFSIGFSLSFLDGLVPPIGFSLNFIPIFSLSGPAWAYCPARPSSPSSTYYLFFSCFSCLSALLHLPSFSKGVCPSGFAQRGNTL